MKVKSEWPGLIHEFEGSGLTHKQFCKKKGIPINGFRSWLYRLRNKNNFKGGFSTISVVENEISAAGIELHFPDGKFLRFSGQPSVEMVRAFLKGTQE